MAELFELEWFGGPAEHHFRKARPGIDDLPWGTVRPADYPPSLVEAARRAWTEVAINEYRAIAAFSEVLRSMTLARAPLDLLGMVSDFLADECVHVELASRMATELGGAFPIEVEMRDLSARPSEALSAFQRANEAVLQVGISEAVAGGTAIGNRKVAAHPLTRAIYDRIVADESRHRRLAELYFEWAGERLDDIERARLAGVALRVLEALSILWRSSPSTIVNGKTRDGWRLADLHALGWLEAAKMSVLARDVVRRDVLAPLDAMGIVIDADRRAHLLDGSPV